MSPPSPSSFGVQLRQYRERAGLTQDALAERAGLTTNAISTLERGTRRRPYLHTVAALATALALSAQEHAALLAARAQSPDAPIPAPRASTPTPSPALPSAHGAVAAPARPLMLTKFHRPQVTVSVVERPRLHAAFRAGVARPLTLVAAPAGYGKTTLVAQQLAALPHPSAWLSLDAGNNDPATFARYLVEAVQSVTASVSAPTRSLAQAATLRLDSVLLSLSNDLAALPHDLVVVLDDYHLLTNPAIHTAMAVLLGVGLVVVALGFLVAFLLVYLVGFYNLETAADRDQRAIGQ